MMHEKEFDQLIRNISSQPLSAPPGGLEDNVLRRVRQAKPKEEHAFFSRLGLLLPNTGFAMLLVALAALISSMVTLASSSAYAADMERRAETIQALDFSFLKSSRLASISYEERSEVLPKAR